MRPQTYKLQHFITSSDNLWKVLAIFLDNNIIRDLNITKGKQYFPPRIRHVKKARNKFIWLSQEEKGWRAWNLKPKNLILGFSLKSGNPAVLPQISSCTKSKNIFSLPVLNFFKSRGWNYSTPCTKPSAVIWDYIYNNWWRVRGSAKLCGKGDTIKAIGLQGLKKKSPLFCKFWI